MEAVRVPIEEIPEARLQQQLNTAKEEIQSLTQQLNCLLALAKNAWRGDQAAALHLARVIGIDPEVEQNNFIEKKVTTRSTTKKTVKIADEEEVTSKQTVSMESSLTSQEPLEQRQQANHAQAAIRNAYLQPFLKQSQIDPIKEERSKQIFNNMVRHHQNETRKSPMNSSRTSSASVRPRATKHLYRPASAEHVVRHLGSPISRARPFFVFAGREFFQRTVNYSPLYQRALCSTANGSRQSEHSDLSDESEEMASPANEPIIARPQTAKSAPQSSSIRLAARSANAFKTPSTLTMAAATKTKPLTERERRDAMRLQRQLNIPREGWLHQRS